MDMDGVVFQFYTHTTPYLNFISKIFKKEPNKDQGKIKLVYIQQQTNFIEQYKYSPKKHSEHHWCFVFDIIYVIFNSRCFILYDGFFYWCLLSSFLLSSIFFVLLYFFFFVFCPLFYSHHSKMDSYYCNLHSPDLKD